MPFRTRRQIPTIGIGFLLTCCLANNARSISNSISDSTEKLFSRSGDDELDRALIAELKKIISILQINPGFKYVNENNAWAGMMTVVKGTRGTVVLGLPLIRELMAEDNGGVGVAAVCAHECGHMYQLENLLFDKLRSNDHPVIYAELHADFLAGYYIGRSGEFGEDRIKQASAVTYRLGDYQYKNLVHHGSPGQRSAAIERGYRAATDGNAVAEAAEVGVSYVKNL